MSESKNLECGDVAKARMHKMLHGKEHWVLIPFDDLGFRAVCEIEERFFSKEAAADFVLGMWGPHPTLGIASLFFAKKERLDAAVLGPIVGAEPEQLKRGDILCLGRDPAVCADVMAWIVSEFDGPPPVGPS